MKKLHRDLISWATGEIEASDEVVIESYNIHFNKSVDKLTEVEFLGLCIQANIVLRNLMRSRQKGLTRLDGIARFVMKERMVTYYRVLIETKGFFFSLFIFLLVEINTNFVKK